MPEPLSEFVSQYPREIVERQLGRVEPEDAGWVNGATPPHDPIVIEESDPLWSEWFATESARLRDALGAVAMRLEHVGSTSVPGLPAKPIIDMDLQVADTEDEDSYVRPLEPLGYRLTLRQPWWNGHRMLVGGDDRFFLHVFPVGTPEPLRHLLFRDWLRTHRDDRELYGDVKRKLAIETAQNPNDYSLAKNEVIDEIYARIFSVPPQAHPAWPSHPGS